MYLYKLSQNINCDYDTFDSCIVCAENPKEARLIHPGEFVTHCDSEHWYGNYAVGNKEEYITEDGHGTWVPRTRVNEIEVELIGTAKESMKKGVVLSSFNAG